MYEKHRRRLVVLDQSDDEEGFNDTSTTWGWMTAGQRVVEEDIPGPGGQTERRRKWVVNDGKVSFKKLWSTKVL